MGTVGPVEILQVNILKLSKVPKGTLLHREAIYWQGKNITSCDGLELFLRKIPENTVVLQFIDGAHKTNGLVSIDFPENCFEGWEEHKLRKDTFLEPPARQLLTSKARGWCRYVSCDIYLQFCLFYGVKHVAYFKKRN